MTHHPHQQQSAADIISAFVKDLPPAHPYRIHLEQHVDVANNRIIRIDRRCEDCQVYLADEKER